MGVRDDEAIAQTREAAATDQIEARRILTRWRDDPALATLRDPAALDELSLAERDEWKSLWADLDTLLVRLAIQKDRPE